MNTQLKRYALLACLVTFLMITGCGGKKIQTIQVISNPDGASVLFDGKSYSNTPTVVDVDKDGMDHYLFVKKDGCEEARKIFRNNQYPSRVTLNLICGQDVGAAGGAGAAGEGGADIKDDSLAQGPSGGASGDSGLYPDVRTRFVQEDVFFAFDSAALDQEAREVLRFKAGWLQDNAAATILIEGHTDERGTGEYNLALGERRALTAQDFLINLGISSERIRTVSFGEERPADPGHDEEAWARNRRAHFIINE